MDMLLHPMVLERLGWQNTKRAQSSSLNIHTHTKAVVDPGQEWILRANSDQPRKLTVSEGPQNGDHSSTPALLPDLFFDL